MPDIRDQYARATASVERAIAGLTEEKLSLPTPCTEWDVRALLNHVIGEVAWLGAMLRGETIEQIGDRFNDVIGTDARKSWETHSRDAVDAVATTPLDAKVQLSSGPATGERYAQEVASDLTVHSWDLARALGAPDALDADLIALVTDVFGPMIEGGRKAGFFGAPPDIAADADEQTKMLALLGRSTDWKA